MIADKIKNARTIKKLTQEQVAEDLNVSRQTISNWENGKSLPDIENAEPSGQGRWLTMCPYWLDMCPLKKV